MNVFETFSKRQKKSQQSRDNEIFIYDQVPYELRVQAIKIIRDVMGHWHKHDGNDTPGPLWKGIRDLLCREMGRFSLIKGLDSPQAECEDFLLSAQNTLHCLDLLDLVVFCFHNIIAKDVYYQQRNRTTLSVEEGVKELNYRFREHHIGYQAEGARLIRVDSQLLHAEVTKPAITLLNEAGFEGPLDEFMSAHQHFCKKSYKESMTDSLKAFESTLKTIFTMRRWTFDPKDPAKKLLDVMFANKLIPDYLTQHFTSLRSLLESVPTPRNRTSGHGQGPEPLAVPDYMASFALHITGSCIVLLIKAHKEKA